MRKTELLQHAVLTELKDAFDTKDFESTSELLELLIEVPQAKAYLVGYLSDDTRERWEAGILERWWELD